MAPLADVSDGFLGDDLDARNAQIVERYKNFNNQEGNSPINAGSNQRYTPSGSQTPDNPTLEVIDGLLVDANLRNPKIASILRFVPPWCFSEQLDQHRNQPFLPWSFVEIAAMGLHVAAINPRNKNPQRLDAPAFAIAMDRLRIGN